MNKQEFEDARLELGIACNQVLEAKGKDYAGEGGDRFANFKLSAELLANFHIDMGTPLGTWAVYYLKHVFAILAWIGQKSESEPIKGRFVDARNYIDLGWGMVKEQDINKPKVPWEETTKKPSLRTDGLFDCGVDRCAGHIQPTQHCMGEL